MGTQAGGVHVAVSGKRLTQFSWPGAIGDRAALVPAVYGARAVAKRGSGVSPATLVDAAGASPAGGIDVLALDEALTRPAALYSEQVAWSNCGASGVDDRGNRRRWACHLFR